MQMEQVSAIVEVARVNPWLWWLMAVTVISVILLILTAKGLFNKSARITSLNADIAQKAEEIADKSKQISDLTARLRDTRALIREVIEESAISPRRTEVG